MKTEIIKTKHQKWELTVGEKYEVRYVIEIEDKDGDTIVNTYVNIGYFYRVETNSSDYDTIVLVNELKNGHLKKHYCRHEDEIHISVGDVTHIGVLTMYGFIKT